MVASKLGRIVFEAIMASVVGKTTAMLRGELEKAKDETVAKLKGIAVGVGLIAFGLAVSFFALGILIAAAVMGLAQAWPAWLAALVIGGGLLLITFIFVMIGVARIKKNKDLKPTDTIDSLKKTFKK